MKANSLSLISAVLGIFLLGSSGCKTYMQYKYGVTQPKEETPAKLISFLEKHHYPEDNQYMFSDSGSYNKAIRNPEFRKHLLSNMIFDRQGKLLQRDTAQCQWSGYDKIKSLKPDSVYEKCSGFNLGQVWPFIVPFGGDSSPALQQMEPDFTVIVTWAKFLGEYNYRLFDLSEALKQNNTARIRVVWLNIDMQESWKLTPAQKVAIR